MSNYFDLLFTYDNCFFCHVDIVVSVCDCVSVNLVMRWCRLFVICRRMSSHKLISSSQRFGTIHHNTLSLSLSVSAPLSLLSYDCHATLCRVQSVRQSSGFSQTICFCTKSPTVYHRVLYIYLSVHHSYSYSGTKIQKSRSTNRVSSPQKRVLYQLSVSLSKIALMTVSVI